VSQLSLRSATQTTEALLELWATCVATVADHRGGVALLQDIDADVSAASLEKFLEHGHIVELLENNRLVGFALVLKYTIELLYVEPTERRKGYGTFLAQQLILDPEGPRDARCLPGDRASKSLYESIGAKARLLTMRVG
jgi:GNAT superfamily N-acetyltransferase